MTWLKDIILNLVFYYFYFFIEVYFQVYNIMICYYMYCEMITTKSS